MTEKTEKKFYIVNLIVFTVYVLVEMVFNSYLLDVAASQESTKAHFDTAEFIGRCVSSTGVTIFVGFFYFKKRGRTPLWLLVVCWLGFFFFQKAVIDIIVMNSTAEQRQASFLLQSAAGASTNNLNLSHFGAASDFERVMLPSYRMLEYGVGSDVVAAVKEITNTHVMNNKELLEEKEKEVYDALVKLIDSYLELGREVDVQPEKVWEGLEKVHSAVLSLKRRAYGAAKAQKSKFRRLASIVEWGLHNGCTSGRRLEYTRMVARNPILKGTLLCHWVEDEARNKYTFKNNPEYFYTQVQHVAVINHFIGTPPRVIKQKFEDAIKIPEYQRFLLSQVVDRYCSKGEFANKEQLVQVMRECGAIDERAGFAYWFISIPEDERVERFLRSEYGAKVVKENLKINASLLLEGDGVHEKFVKQLKIMLSNEMTEALVGSGDEFYLAGGMYEQGADSLRVLVAVPLALMLSLLFSVIGVIRLICEALKPLFDSVKSTYILLGLLVSLVFLVPFGGEYGSYKNSMTLSWALKYQPVVYFIGKGVRTAPFS
ncbi:hypothetical protein [Pseudoalteromonas sp. MEBiC 03485]|uniref:hypothetical protein n=1 Tax=Pseudoalteromonas sp. MEBiC 03485 TaxID=2571103 RepID=UPI0010221BD8|nr:hypothetical protein [Pseudoalteromonas sp. MEBiC 03485]RZD19602.1 hypothetical protein EVU92_20590 [Pseudoalteromonas sp. MEBiC 03485]